MEFEPDAAQFESDAAQMAVKEAQRIILEQEVRRLLEGAQELNLKPPTLAENIKACLWAGSCVAIMIGGCLAVLPVYAAYIGAKRTGKELLQLANRAEKGILSLKNALTGGRKPELGHKDPLLISYFPDKIQLN